MTVVIRGCSDINTKPDEGKGEDIRGLSCEKEMKKLLPKVL